MKLTKKEKDQIIKQACEDATKILAFAFEICELKTHIHSTLKSESKAFKLKFEPTEFLNEVDLKAERSEADEA